MLSRFCDLIFGLNPGWTPRADIKALTAGDTDSSPDLFVPPAPRASGSVGGVGRGSAPGQQPLFDRDIEVPGLGGHQRAYNAGLARHRGRNVLVFRLESTGGPYGHDNQIGALALSHDYRPVGAFSLLETPHIPHTLHTAEDPRAVDHHGRLMVIFNLSDNGQVGGPRHMHIGEVRVDDAQGGPRFTMRATWRLIFTAPGRGVPAVEKNWSPFSFDRKLHFIYRTNPNLVIRLDEEIGDQNSGSTLYPATIERLSDVRFHWPAGECRGGTQAIFDSEMDRFVTFFHSSHSDRAFTGTKGHASLTYFFGCLTFRPHPPFDIDQVSEFPIATAGMIRELLRGGEEYGKRILFVQGLIAERDRFVLSYGRGDSHVGVCSLDRRQVLVNLRPVPR